MLVNFKYKLIKQAHNLGLCEVCSNPVETTYHQIETREYLPNRYTHYQCHDLFGHRDCLVNKQKIQVGI